MNIDKIIKESVIDAIQNNADKIFRRSQETVPVQTGELKFSGNKKDTENGAEIEYTADHAQKIEYGIKGKDVSSEETTVYVPAHRRKDGTFVKGHYKTYKGKVVTFKPKDSDKEITRVFTQFDDVKGRYFLTNATLEEIESFIEDLTDSLEDADWGEEVKRVEVKFEVGK